MRKFIISLIALFVVNIVLSQTVYITKTGEKYHVDGCRYLSKSKIAISLNDATQRGFTACSICRPPTSSSSTRQTIIPSRSETKISVSVQCAATTKAGTRCKRTTKSTNGYCWQHGGN